MNPLNIIMSTLTSILILPGHAFAEARISANGFFMCPTGKIEYSAPAQKISNSYLLRMQDLGYEAQFVGNRLIFSQPQLYQAGLTCESYDKVRKVIDLPVQLITVGSAWWSVAVAPAAPLAITVIAAVGSSVVATEFIVDNYICDQFYQSKNEVAVKQMIQEGVCEVLKKENGGKEVCNSSGSGLVKPKESFDNMCRALPLGSKT